MSVVSIQARPYPLAVGEIVLHAVNLRARALSLEGLFLRLAAELPRLTAREGGEVRAAAAALSLADELEAANLHLLAVEAELREILAGGGAGAAQP